MGIVRTQGGASSASVLRFVGDLQAATGRDPRWQCPFPMVLRPEEEA